MTPIPSPRRALEGSLEREREDLEGLFTDVVVAVFGEEAEEVTSGSVPDAALDGAAASSGSRCDVIAWNGWVSRNHEVSFVVRASTTRSVT